MSVEKQVATTVIGITPRKGAEGEYWQLETTPISPSKFSGKFYIRGEGLLKGFEAGDNIMLTLERGKAKVEGATQDWDFWWEVKGISKAETPKEKPPVETLKEVKVPLLLPLIKEIPVTPGLPWHRFVAWGELAREARQMVADTASLGETPPPEEGLKTYAQRFMWAMNLICSQIRQQMLKE